MSEVPTPLEFIETNRERVPLSPAVPKPRKRQIPMLVIVLILGILMAGAFLASHRRPVYRTSRETVAATERKVRPYMTMDGVQSALGNPARQMVDNSPLAHYQFWLYPCKDGSLQLSFVNGSLVSVNRI